MIYSVSGKLELVEPYQIVIDCNGIGYLIKTSMNTISRLPVLGENIKLFTQMIVKEDGIELIGFLNTAELSSFKKLISVSGVGPKSAVLILSDMTPEQLALCIASNDAKTLTKAQGIGLKTAQRIILELKDKISQEEISSGIVGTAGNVAINATNQNASEAITALEVLGYSRADATRIVTSLDSNMSVEDMIKNGLKALAGKV